MNRHTRTDDGFSLIEVNMASILVIVFTIGVASSFGTAFGIERGNLLRQQATGVVNQEVEYARSMDWSDLAMSWVDTAAPMLGTSGATLRGDEAGFTGEETLVVFTDTGLVTPHRYHDVDGTRYSAWRYVTHSPGGLRRFVVLVTWANEGASESLLSSTLISEVTARANEGAVVTLPDGTPASTTTTSSTSTSTTTSSTSTTTTSSTTTTTLPGLVIETMTLTIDYGNQRQTAQVSVDFASGGNANGALVKATWSVTPAELGYPFDVQILTSGPGRATFLHNDGHPDGAVVEFCVTDIILPGYSYSGGTQCVSELWG